VVLYAGGGVCKLFWLPSVHDEAIECVRSFSERKIPVSEERLDLRTKAEDNKWLYGDFRVGKHEQAIATVTTKAVQTDQLLGSRYTTHVDSAPIEAQWPIVNQSVGG